MCVNLGCNQCEVERLVIPEHQTFVDNPLMVFTDSMGLTLSFEYEQSKIINCDVFHNHLGNNNGCDAGCEYESARFSAGPGPGSFDLKYGRLEFEYALQALTDFDVVDTTITLQGQQFDNCKFKFGEVGPNSIFISWAYSPQYGIVLLEKENEFRWERVLNP